MYINMNEILDKFSQFTSSYKISFDTEIVNFKFSTKNLQKYSPYCLYIFRANKLPKEIFNYIIKNRELDKITIDKIKSLNISEEYIKNINNIEIEEINTYTIDSTKEIIKKIRKNTIENEIKSMSIQIERLSKELDLLKKSNSNTKEVDDKIMKLSLEILKREKIKKDL